MNSILRRIKKNLTNETQSFIISLSLMLLRASFSFTCIPFRTPAVLLLSFPRSGSSWVGDVLATSPEFSYLYEPVNLPYLHRYKKGISLTADDEFYRESAKTYNYFEKLTNQSFSGMPPAFSGGTSVRKRFFWHKLKRPLNFFLFGRRGKTLLIKEVLPTAAPFFVKSQAPRVIYILRHPAAVADSYFRLGWMTVGWQEFGYIYGARTRFALSALENESAKIVYYEDLVKDPRKGFKELFEFSGVEVPHDLNDTLKEFCGVTSSDSPFETRRNSEEQLDKWKENLNREQIDLVMRGYREAGLEHYT